MSDTPRAYQDAAVESLREKMRAKIKRLVLVSATGSGKTTMASTIIASAVTRGRRILFLAHQRKLIHQASKRLDRSSIAHGIVMAADKRARPDLPVQVASIQTLARRMDALPDADLVIVDECHHSCSDTYTAVLEHYEQSGAYILGLTATPWRGDRKGLASRFDDVVVATTPAELIKMGFLVPYEGFAYLTPNMKGAKKSSGDYTAEELEKRVTKNVELAGAIIAEWKQHAFGLRTIAFCVSIAHSMDLRDRFLAAGVAADHVDGTMNEDERDLAFGKFARGETTVLCSCNLITEGFDEPRAECGIMARPTCSLVLALQMPGRLFRPSCLDCGIYAHPQALKCDHCGSANIKRRALLHDHAGVFKKHGLPDDDQDYSLAQDKPPKPDPVKQCKFCFAAFRGTVCPRCGKAEEDAKEAGGKKREIEEVAATQKIPLKDLIKQKTGRARNAVEYRAELEAFAKERGWKPGWVHHQYEFWLTHGGPGRLAKKYPGAQQ